MDLTDYQRRAVLTDQIPGDAGDGLIVPLLGLAGEAGTLLSEYKKFLRDGEAHRLHRERVSEELGDLLWYLSNVASKYDLDLSQIAQANLAKTLARWGRRRRSDSGEEGALALDSGFPEQERLLRRFEVEITEVRDLDGVKMRAYVAGLPLGQALTDNAYDPDGYRFHDAFHLAYAAVLGWSPVVRALLDRKRRSNPTVDEVEDGGRAIIIEEAVAALAFDYAKAHAFLDGVTALDESIIKTIMGVTAHLEVSRCVAGDWEYAIFKGFDVWRQLVHHRQGRLVINLDERSLIFQPA